MQALLPLFQQIPGNEIQDSKKKLVEVAILEFIKATELTSPEANTNVWIFIVGTICCVVGFLAVQVWLQSGKLTGIKTNYQIMQGQIESLNAKIDQFLKKEIEVLQDIASRRK